MNSKKPSSASAPPKEDVHERAERVLEVTREKWRRDEWNKPEKAARGVDQAGRGLAAELSGNLDTALAVADLMAQLFGYQRDGIATESDHPAQALSMQWLQTRIRSSSATLAGNDDFYGSGVRRRRASGAARREVHPWKK